MKLPWNKKYLIIAFHIIVTVILIYSLKYCIDFLVYVFSNMSVILGNISSILKWISSVFSVVIIAFIIAYLLDPIVEFFHRRYVRYILPKLKDNKKKVKLLKKKKQKNTNNIEIRTFGTIATYAIFLIFFIIIMYILVMKIKSSGSGNNILENITSSIKNSVSVFVNDFSNIYYKIESYLKTEGIFDYISPQLNKFIALITNFISGMANGMIDIITSVANGIINIIISIVIAFYFLRDKATIKNKFEEIGITFLPRKIYRFIKNSLGDIHAVFSGYIRGTLLDASIMAILISISLSAIGVNFAVIIGFISGFSNIIPYFGALMGFILAISVSLISGEPINALYSTIVMLILQQIDTIFIAPKVIGESVELSPVLVLVSLFAAGKIFGLFGMIFAVPVFATIKLFATRIYERKKIKKEALKSFK